MTKLRLLMQAKNSLLRTVRPLNVERPSTSCSKLSAAGWLGSVSRTHKSVDCHKLRTLIVSIEGLLGQSMGEGGGGKKQTTTRVANENQYALN